MQNLETISTPKQQIPNREDASDRSLWFFENAPFGIGIIEHGECFQRVNGALCTILGYPARELLATPWTKLTHPDDTEQLLKKTVQLIEGLSQSQEMECQFIHHGGSLLWVRLKIWPIKDGQNPPCFAVQLEDMTGHKRVMEALSESEERFRVMADNSPSMMWATDAEGSIQFINKTCRTFYGTDAEGLDRNTWKQLIHPSDVSEHSVAFERAIREHTAFSAEARFQRADGEWRLLGSNARPSTSSSGKYLGHIGLSADVTERRKTEEAREFELSLIRSIHEETLEGILVVNREGLIVSLNRRFSEIWMMSRADAPKQLPCIDVGDTDRLLLSHIAELIETPESVLKRVQQLYDHPDEEDHCELKLRDGRTVERHSTGLQNHEGKYLGRVWFFRDITAHKQAEVGLQNAMNSADEASRQLLAKHETLESERRMLRALIDSVPDFMYVKDTKSRFVLANCHLARVVGAETPEELLGKTDFDFYAPELAQGFYEDDQNVMRSGKPLYNREEKGLDAEGKESRILTTKVPILDTDGQSTGLAGVGRDITARKKIEDALREAEQKYRGIFDNTIVGIFQSTPEGNFLSVNHAMASTLGYDSPEEMMTSAPNISRDLYVDPEGRQEFLLSMSRPGNVQNFEHQVFRKDRTKIWLSVSICAVFQDGEAIRYEGMCEDITERNALREQLLQAQKLESVGQLAAGIAHEINTPTQYIGDNVRFLKDAFQDIHSLLAEYEQLLQAAQESTWSSDSIHKTIAVVERVDAGYLLEEIPKAIEQTLEGVTRVSTLVSAMKEFSHPGTKEKIPLDLNHAIDSTITVARNEWKYVADMETDFDPSLPLIPCQPGEFNQVILNLIVNAAHAIADVIRERGIERGKIRVQTRNCPDWAEIRIQDTGSGIPEEIRARIFDPFFTTKEVGKGTGQGLAIARSVVVDKHGGTIHFETEKGMGTTFIIRLPQNGQAFGPKAIIS